jgi:hypothetical protein
MLHPLVHPAIERLAVEPDDPTVSDEWNLTAADAVIERVAAHAQILRGRVHVEPARLDDRSRSNVHGETPVNCRGCCREGPIGCRHLAGTAGIVGAALGFSGPVDGSGLRLELTSGQVVLRNVRQSVD